MQVRDPVCRCGASKNFRPVYQSDPKQLGGSSPVSTNGDARDIAGWGSVSHTRPHFYALTLVITDQVTRT